MKKLIGLSVVLYFSTGFAFEVSTPYSLSPFPDENTLKLQFSKPFNERSPNIDDLILIKKDQHLEVSVEYRIPSKCYDSREVDIQKLKDRIRLVPRFRQNDLEKICGAEKVSELWKLADLEIPASGTLRVEVLGWEGWHSKEWPTRKQNSDSVYR